MSAKFLKNLLNLSLILTLLFVFTGSTKASDAPTVQFTLSSSNNSENVAPVILEISLSTTTVSDVTVDYTISGGTATAGVDYTIVVGTATITAGNTVTNVQVATVIDDSIHEANETIIATLSNPTNASLGANINHTYTINDNEVLVLTGLNDDPTPTKSKTYSWSSNDPSATYRYVVDQDLNGVPTGLYTEVTTMSQSSGTGTYYLHVQAKDVDDVEGSVTTVYFILDNTAPTITGLADDATPTKSKTYIWSSNDPSATYRYVVDQDLNGVPSGSYSDVVTVSQTNGTGTYYIHVQAKDSLDNVSAVSTNYFILDNTAPTITGLADDATPAKIKSYTWSSDDPNATYRYLIDQNLSNVPTDSYSEIKTATQSSGTGTYYLHVQAIDTLGNVSGVTTISFILDNTAPTIYGLANDATPAKSKTYVWSSDDPNATYRYKIDQNPTNDLSDSYSLITTATQSSGTGTYYIHVQATDTLGNESPIYNNSFILDNTAPTISGLADDATPAKTKTYVWSSNDPNATYRFLIDQDPSGVPSGSYSETVTASQTTGNGKYYLHVQAIDTLGNVSGVSTVSFILDNTAPTISGISNSSTPVKSKTLTWTSDDENATYRFAIDQSASWTVTGNYGSTVTVTQADGTGTYYLHVQVTDTLGNESAVTTISFILDNQTPVITILGDNPTNTYQNQSYNDAGATATDVIDGSLTSSITTTNTVDTSTTGIYTITYSVTDTAGNTATANRTVTVVGRGGGGTSFYLNIPTTSVIQTGSTGLNNLTTPTTIVDTSTNYADNSANLPMIQDNIIAPAPANLNQLLSDLGATRNPEKESDVQTKVSNDLKLFNISSATADEKLAMANFIAYGISAATKKIGERERRAIIRDYIDSTNNPAINWQDIELITTGQKPQDRNLNQEQAQLPKVLTVFKNITGDQPNFENQKDDLIWNTLMYRIRFARDLSKEQLGIGLFQSKMGRLPQSPLDWAAVRALGYVK